MGIDFCANCAEPTPDGSGRCDDYPQCHPLGPEEWRDRVDEHLENSDDDD